MNPLALAMGSFKEFRARSEPNPNLMVNGTEKAMQGVSEDETMSSVR